MMMRKYFRKLLWSLLLIFWVSHAYAFYPFCEDVSIIYFGGQGSLVEQWAFEFQKELKQQFNFKDKVRAIAACDLNIGIATVNQYFKEGKLDIAIVPARAVVETVPSFRILTFPGIVARDHEIEALQSKKKFLEKLEVLAAERGVTLLGVGWRFTALTFAREKKITALLDLAGKKIRIAHEDQNGAVLAVRANPIQMPLGEVYYALPRGSIDGAIFPFSYSAKLAEQEVIQSIVCFERGGFGALSYVLFMRKELFYRPDDKARKKIKKAGQIASNRFAQLSKKERDDVIGKLGKLGVQVSFLKDNEYMDYQSRLEENIWSKLIWDSQARDLLQKRKKDIE